MSEASKVDSLRTRVAAACRIIGARGLSRGSFGHVSARIPGTDHVLIKAKGPEEEALEFATERDVIRLDLQGRVLEAPPGLDAPNETVMHLAIYRSRPNVMSVIHSHPHWVVVLTACEKPLVPMYGAYDGQGGLRLLEEGIPTYPRTVTVVNDELAAEFIQVMGERRACLLRGHGMTVAGASVEEATATSLSVNDLAYMNYLAYSIGGPLPVPDLEDHRRRWREGAGKRRPRAAHTSGEPSVWRYNLKRLERP